MSSEAVFFEPDAVDKSHFCLRVPAMLAAASLKAQTPPAPVPAVQPAQGVSAPTAASAAAKAEPAAEVVPQAAPTLFTVLGLPVTNSMICTWIVAALILVIVRLTTWKLKEIPTGGQNVMEALVEGWEGLMGDILDKRVARWVFPFATTFFIFIVISNLVDLVPGVGSIGFGTPKPNSSLPFAIDHVDRPFFRPPTTDANLTVAMAGIFLVMSIFWGVRYNGVWGLVKHIFGVKMETNNGRILCFSSCSFSLARWNCFLLLSRDRLRWPCGFTETFLPVKAYWTWCFTVNQ